MDKKELEEKLDLLKKSELIEMIIDMEKKIIKHSNKERQEEKQKENINYEI